jgi:hypothetical protein
MLISWTSSGMRKIAILVSVNILEDSETY